MSVKVNDMRMTVAGEGLVAGAPAFVITLQGCSVGCKFCHSRHTWDSSEDFSTDDAGAVTEKIVKSELWSWVPEDVIADLAKDSLPRGGIALITGGEPFEQDLGRLLLELIHNRGICTHIQTSGAFPITGSARELIDRGSEYRLSLSVSPPYSQARFVDQKILLENMAIADEVRWLVREEQDIDDLHDASRIVKSKSVRRSLPVFYVQPIDRNPMSTSLCLQACREHGYRLSPQLSSSERIGELEKRQNHP